MTLTPELGRELRVASGLEFRRSDDAAHIVQLRGYASVTEHTYDVAGGPEMGGWSETIKRGAFTRSLNRDVNRALLLHHDGSKVIATTRAGGLTLVEDSVGLLVTADIDTRVSWLNDLAIQVESGTIDEMSIGFYATSSEWSRDYSERSIDEVKLVEATVTWAGANPATVATIERSRDLVNEVRAAAVPKVDRVRIAAQAAIASLSF
jgi:HK97 family phage prohead protease